MAIEQVLPGVYQIGMLYVNAFLVVQTSRGERYTRTGSLTLDNSGQLVTQSGDLVIGDGGPITVPPGEVTIGDDGTISANGQFAGRLKLPVPPRPAK